MTVPHELSIAFGEHFIFGNELAQLFLEFCGVGGDAGAEGQKRGFVGRGWKDVAKSRGDRG
jgi:hypothetical protein